MKAFAAFGLVAALLCLAKLSLAQGIPPDEAIQACVAEKLAAIAIQTQTAKSATALASCNMNPGPPRRDPVTRAPGDFLSKAFSPETNQGLILVNFIRVQVNNYSSPNWLWSTVTYSAPIDYVIETMSPKVSVVGDAQIFSAAVTSNRRSATLETRCKRFYSGEASGFLEMTLRRVPNEAEELAAYGQCIYGR